MNEYSKLCCFMAENKNWRNDLEEIYGIRIKEKGNYAIFKYDNNCDFSDPIVQEARGIIIDTEKLTVVCWPFRKFGCYDEYYADPIDWRAHRYRRRLMGLL